MYGFDFMVLIEVQNFCFVWTRHWFFFLRFFFFFWCAMILSSFYFSQFHDVREESFPLKSIFPFLNKWFPLKFCCSLWWKNLCNTWKAKSAYNGLVFVCLTVASDISARWLVCTFNKCDQFIDVVESFRFCVPIKTCSMISFCMMWTTAILSMIFSDFVKYIAEALSFYSTGSSLGSDAF